MYLKIFNQMLLDSFEQTINFSLDTVQLAKHVGDY